MPSPVPPAVLSPKAVLALAVATVGAFHLGFSFPAASVLVFASLAGLVALRRTPCSRWAFYTGLGIGLGIYGPQLAFFWGIFGPGAAALWLVLAFWHAVFLLLLHQAHRHAGRRGIWIWAAVLWLGIEYFRSELYYLRFAWLTAGYALPLAVTRPLLPVLGVYGWGALAMALAGWTALSLEALAAGLPRRRDHLWRLAAAALVTAILLLAPAHSPAGSNPAPPGADLKVAGVQMEFPGVPEVLQNLRRVTAEAPEAQLVVLSEYTFDGPVPDRVRAWCRQERRWLIAGGTEPLSDGRFHNTVWIIDTNGAVVFQQAKAVPIQFFKDGEPAPRQQVWESPWGRLGLCVCYDLNYARVTDRLIRQGAQALIVPTMDVESWGIHEHHLNARLAPIRAAEYGVPLFRVASSGISQCIDARGVVQASTSVPGAGEIISGSLRLAPAGRTRLPGDRMAAPLAVGAAAAAVLGLARAAWRQRRRPPPSPSGAPSPANP